MGLNLERTVRGGIMTPLGNPGGTPAALRISGWAFAVAGILVALQLLALPVLLRDDPYWLSVATNANILSVGGLGLWLMFSIGRIDIAQGAFAAIGGYTTAILSTRYGISFWVCLPLSALSAALVAAVIGWPILRLKGVYFAMITLSLTEVARLTALNGGPLTNGADGLVAIPQAALLDGPMQFYLLSAVLMLLAALLVWRIAGSRIGSIFRSMRQNEDLASSLGINITRYRIIAFAIASGMGGVCGSFLAGHAVNHRFTIGLSGLTSRRFSGVERYIEDNDLACYLGSSQGAQFGETPHRYHPGSYPISWGRAAAAKGSKHDLLRRSRSLSRISDELSGLCPPHPSRHEHVFETNLQPEFP